MGMKEWIAKLDGMTPEEKLATITLDEVRFYDNAMVLSWSGVIGFGEYTIVSTRETHVDSIDGSEVTDSFFLAGDSEHTDLYNDNKKFLRHLLNQLIDKVDLSEEKARADAWEQRQKNKEVFTDE